jgi:putative ABC transport system substrate-binding protein
MPRMIADRCKALAAGLGLLASAGAAQPALAQDVTVATTAIVEHPALDAVRDGVRDALVDAGYEPGESLEFLYETAQGNPATAVQIARQFVGLQPDVIVPISTPSAQAVVAATGDVPVVFSAVTDPLAAELVTDLETPGGNVTGVSDLTPIADHLRLIREILPEAEVLGVPYNPGEANAVALLAVIREAAPEAGFAVVEAAAPRSADVQSAAQNLAGRADVIYVPTDNTIVSALESVLAVGEAAQIPVFSGDTDSVERGAIASLGFDYYEVGRQTGEVVLQVLDGTDPGSIPVTFAQGSDLYVNPAAADRMGVELPPEVLDRATEIVGEEGE